MMPSKKIIFFGFVFVSFLGCISGRSTKVKREKTSYSFVFMTDIHLQPEKNAIQGFHKAIDSVNEIKPDFVIFGGDNIMDAFAQTWTRSDSLYSLLDSMQGFFNMPIYTTIGNHDLFGVYEKSSDQTTHPEYGKMMYQKRITERYYSFEHKNWHYIVLDAINITNDRRYTGYIDEEQCEWLKNELNIIGKQAPIVIITHIPLLSVEALVALGPTKAFKDNSIVNNANEVRQLFKNHNVKMVLQGHTHFLEDIFYEGIHYITGGAVSGSVWNGKRYEMEEGFLYIEITENNDFTWKYVDYGWEVQTP